MIAYALDNRPELQESKITMENSRINMKGVKNAMLPGLDVIRGPAEQRAGRGS